MWLDMWSWAEAGIEPRRVLRVAPPRCFPAASAQLHYNVEYIDEHNRVEKVINRHLPTKDGNKINPRDPSSVIEFVCYAWNKLFKRDFLVKNQLFYEKGLSRIEDAEFMSRFIAYAPKVKFIENGEYIYEQRVDMTLSKGYDPTITRILKRRKEIDLKLINFFNQGLSVREKVDIENRLNASVLISAVNRLFDSEEESKSLLFNLNKIKNDLMTENIDFSGRHFIRRYFDLITYYALKHNRFSIIKIIQKIR